MKYGWVYFIVLLYIGLCRTNVSKNSPVEYVPAKSWESTINSSLILLTILLCIALGTKDWVEKNKEQTLLKYQNVCNVIKEKKIINKNKNRKIILENNIDLNVNEEIYLKVVIGQTLGKDLNNKECLDISEDYLNYKR